jgi:hypothetical protein
MTPKEKAEELVIEYWHLLNDLRIAKQCALIAVDEILKELFNDELYYLETKIHYWQEVKQEIQKL